MQNLYGALQHYVTTPDHTMFLFDMFFSFFLSNTCTLTLLQVGTHRCKKNVFCVFFVTFLRFLTFFFNFAIVLFSFCFYFFCLTHVDLQERA